MAARLTNLERTLGSFLGSPCKREPVTSAAGRKMCLELVARYRMELERPPMGALYPPAGLFANDADDPFDGDHGFVSWAEARDIAEVYARIIEERELR